jgi:hypothetical protein
MYGRFCSMPRLLAVALFALLLAIPAVFPQGAKFQADSDWEEFEEEEFEAAAPVPEQKHTTKAGAASAHGKDAPAKAPQNAEEAKPTSRFSFALTPALGDWFYVETACVVLLAVFAANYYYGRQSNRRIALSWGRAFAQLLDSNFSRVGEGGGLLIKESENRYRVPATGRRNCHGLQATINLSRRHDLFAMVYEFFMPSQDTVTVEVALEDNIDPLVFALVPNSRAKAALKDVTDLSLFARQVAWPDLSEWFAVIAESEDAASLVLSKQVASSIAKYHKLVRLIHISDHFQHVTYKRMMRFELVLPAPEQMEELVTLMRMIIFLIDYLPTVKLPPAAKARADKKRAKAAEDEAKNLHAQRQEAAQQKKLEKKAKDKEKLKDLPPEQQARAEEREARRVRKKKMGKLKVVYG